MGLLFKTLANQRLRYKGFLLFFLLMTLIVSITSVVMTRLTGEMGQAALDMDMGVLLRFIIIITGIMVIRAVASAASALFLGRFAGKAGYTFRDNFVKYFLQKPFAAFENTKSGESLSVFSNDLPAAVELVSNGGIRMIADFITIAVAFAYMMYLNWWLTLIFFASFPVLIVMQVLISVPIQKKSERRLETRAHINAVANDSFQNTSTVVAYSLENIMDRRCRKAFDEWVEASKRQGRSFLLLILAGMIASFSPILIIIAISAYRVIAGSMNIAEWIAFTSLASEAGGWLTMLSQRQNQVQTTAAGAKRMGEHIAGELEDIHKGSALTPSGDTAISVNNLKFSYGVQMGSEISDSMEAADGYENNDTEYIATEDNESSKASPIALDGVSFEIKKGSRVAFVGGSGSGKSTVLKLLLGLYTPQEGSISIFGADTVGITLQSLRDVFAYLPQDSYLFPESILENITGELVISEKLRLEKACSDAGVLDFVKSLPDGFDSTLSESAENISGGQKQRIAIARAFYRDAPIILFDEATSALDPATEAAVLQSFGALAKDKTVLMVAHRLKAINFCDTIVVMESGKVVAIGTHDDLLNNSPVYANLYEAQQKEVPA
jgi:ABC-type multidrug transport system fused ATPase/permease subunit